MSCMLKWIYVLPKFQNKLKSWKTNHSVHDFKQRKITYSGSKKIIYIIKGNNVKICWRILLFELSSVVQNKKQTYLRSLLNKSHKKYVKIKIFVVLQWFSKTLSLIITGNLIRHHLILFTDIESLNKRIDIKKYFQKIKQQL